MTTTQSTPKARPITFPVTSPAIRQNRETGVEIVTLMFLDRPTGDYEIRVPALNKFGYEVRATVRILAAAREQAAEAVAEVRNAILFAHSEAALHFAQLASDAVHRADLNPIVRSALMSVVGNIITPSLLERFLLDVASNDQAAPAAEKSPAAPAEAVLPLDHSVILQRSDDDAWQHMRTGVRVERLSGGFEGVYEVTVPSLDGVEQYGDRLTNFARARRVAADAIAALRQSVADAYSEALTMDRDVLVRRDLATGVEIRRSGDLYTLRGPVAEGMATYGNAPNLKIIEPYYLDVIGAHSERIAKDEALAYAETTAR